MKIPTRENILFVSICKPIIFNICLVEKPIVGNMVPYFLHHLKAI